MNENSIIYGRIPVIVCFKAGRRRVLKLYLQEGVVIPELKPYLSTVQIEYKSKDFLNKITRNGVHQGVVAEVEDLFLWKFDEWYHLEAPSKRNVVFLDHIEDPRNFGAIIRSAVAFDFDAVLFTREGSAPLTPVTVKASAGAIEYANLIGVNSAPRALRKLKELGYKVVALEADGEVPINKVEWSEKNVIVIGSEGKGIRHVIKNIADCISTIPTGPEIPQLNASVSAGIAFYVLRTHIE